jgi:hypothetical protein
VNDKTRAIVGMAILVMIVTFGITTVGCQGERPKTPNAMRPPLTIDRFVPQKATNVEKVSDTMVYFELRVGGRDRKFLITSEYTNGGGRRELIELQNDWKEADKLKIKDDQNDRSSGSP